MKLIYEGVDITAKVSINSCIHEMYAEQRSDSLKICFNDTRSLWTEWNPKKGKKVQLTEGDENTGVMYVSNVSPENGLFTLRAMSMPLSGETIKSRSWEKVKFMQLGRDIATAHGLAFSSYGVTDQTYAYIKQERQTDFEFFNQRCQLEGCAMLIYDGRLVVYNEHSIESKSASGKINAGADGVFEYSDDSALSYGSAEITSGQYKGVYTTSNGNASRILRPKTPIYCTSDAEATRYAKGLLRAANKNSYTGTLRKNLLRGYAAASLIELSTDKASAWNGVAFITRIRHDLVHGESKIFFRKPLEGY